MNENKNILKQEVDYTYSVPIILKICPRCNREFSGKKKFCSDNCRYWFNQIKKEKEQGLPPATKRNDKYFWMITGIERFKMKGNGKRCRGAIQGGMSATVYTTVEKIMPLTEENIKIHFKFDGKRFNYSPSFIRLGNGDIIKKEEIYLKFGMHL